MRSLLLAVLFVLFAFGSATVTFDGHQVLRVVPKNEAQLNLVLQYSKPEYGMDFWTDAKGINQPVDIRVPPQAQASFVRTLQEAKIDVSVFVRDVQQLINKQHSTQDQANFYANYHSLEEITTWMKQLVAQNPDLVTFSKIGTSYEGRDLNILTITAPSSTLAPKTAIWIDGCIHAREWITTATLLYMTGTLLDQYKANNQTVVNLLKNMVIYVMPVFNVDGYEYTWTTNRMWRKTRSANSGSSCVGTDPNRNWDWHWGEAGADPDPCSESFYGSAPFSEVEVRTVADFIWKHADTIRGYINFHSYSQLWMSPWGYTSDLPKDYQVQNDLSKACVDALTSIHGTSYQYGPIASTIYPASGSSADWTYGNSSIIYSYGVELRDQGQYGFVLPAREIVPSGEETYASLLVFAQTVLGNNRNANRGQVLGAVRVN